MSRPIPPSYKTKNWPAYNEALKQRGSLTIWFDPDMAWVPPPTGKQGWQPQYSDAAIQTCLTMKVLFGVLSDEFEPVSVYRENREPIRNKVDATR